jgi:hypothetical protein
VTATTPDTPRGCGWLHVAAAAVILTALNAAKPVHIDDPVYLAYAAEFAAHPLDPYGFEFGTPLTRPANALLVPPVVIYWLGLGQVLVCDSPGLLKCWLFPFALLLAAGVNSLAGRAAPSLRAPVLWLAVLSPTLLPGFNLMLDTPVAALGVAAVAAAVRATERASISLTLTAGVLAALAVQTKYTGAVSAAAVVGWLLLQRRWRYAAVAGLAALGLVVGWEWFVAQAQGESHFLVQLRQRQGKPLDRAFHLVLPLVSQGAGLAPAVALLGWAPLRRRVVPAAVVVAGAFAALVLTDSQAALVATAEGKAVLTPSNLVYGVLALVVWPALVGVVLRLVRGDALDRFLVAWLLLEVAGYFALSPFPAARRLDGPLLVMTLAAGRLAHRTGVSKRTAAWIAAAGAALALLVFAADAADARAARDAARLAARCDHTPAAGGTFWHFCWWGVGYYAEQEGLRQLQLNRAVPRAGDLIAVHDVAEVQQFMRIQPVFRVELLETIETGDSFPLRAAPGYYDGRTPLESARGVRTRVFVYRVTAVPP